MTGYHRPVKISGFSFLRNGQKLGYPFVESIRSILPIVDEFVIALGPCDDDTEKVIRHDWFMDLHGFRTSELTVHV